MTIGIIYDANKLFWLKYKTPNKFYTLLNDNVLLSLLLQINCLPLHLLLQGNFAILHEHFCVAHLPVQAHFMYPWS
jgi:hypothetical protein